MTTYAHNIGEIVNNATILALPTGTGAYGDMYQLQRADGYTYYAHITPQQDEDTISQAELIIEGFEVNSSHPLPVYLASGSSGSSGGGVGTTTTPNVSTLADPTTPTHQAAVLAPGSSGTYALSIQGVTSGIPLPVTGTFWQATQPISAASLPLPSGAATAAKQPALGTAGTPASDIITVQGVTNMTALKTDGSGVTQPISASTLPLPAGAATSAKQPALGTAGASSTDVLSVQGISSGTPLSVAEYIGGSAVSATNPLPTTAGQFARTDKSGTIATGGTAQNVFTAGSAVHGFYFQNLSSVPMYIRDDGTAASATSGSILVAANGGYYESPSLSSPTSLVSVFCSTTSSAYTCKVW